MDYQQIVKLVNTDSVVQSLLKASIPMRLSYVGLDGHPRAIPVAYLWNGKAFVFASKTTSYKVRAISSHPQIAFTVDTTDFTPLIMMVRGTASIEVRQGIPQEYIDAARRIVGDDEMAEWERFVRANISEMALITILPTHITVCDFITRFPPG